jgi:hypothetical protein
LRDLLKLFFRVMVFKLDISGHMSKQMMTSVVYKRISDLLIDWWKKELFPFIKSIKINWWNLLIKTEKPIVNAELKIFEERIAKILVEVSANFWLILRDTKISFK